MGMTENEVLGNIIAIRNKQRLSQDAIAKGLSVTNATYSRIESGEIALTYKRLTDIATFFKMRVTDVITYPEVLVSQNTTNSTKVIVELDVSSDEFIKLGLKDKVLQVLDK